MPPCGASYGDSGRGVPSSPAAVARRSPKMNRRRNPCRIRHRRWLGRGRPGRRAIPWPAGYRRHGQASLGTLPGRVHPPRHELSWSARHGTICEIASAWTLEIGASIDGDRLSTPRKDNPTPWREARGGIECRRSSSAPAPAAGRDTRRASRRTASMREPVVGPAAAPITRLARQRWSNPPPLPIDQGSPAQDRPGSRS